MKKEGSKKPLESGASKVRVTDSEAVNPFVANSRKTIELSEKEIKLLELIKASTVEKVTIKLIENIIGKEYIGALGKLLGKELIESKKYREQFNPLCPTKMTKYYAVKKKEIND